MADSPDYSNINSRDIPKPPNYEGPNKEFSFVANTDATPPDQDLNKPWDRNERKF